MKKIIITVFFLVVIVSDSMSQYVTIPDPGFRDYLSAFFNDCMSGNQLDTTCAHVTDLQILSIDESIIDVLNIQDLTGLEYFKSLVTLTIGSPDLMDIAITTIPSFPKKIKNLNIYYTSSVTTLPALPDSLTALHLEEMEFLTSFPPFPPKLKWLKMVRVYAPIPALPNGCEYFYCDNCGGPALPFLPNSMRDVIGQQSTFSTFSQATLPDSLRRLDLNNTSFSALPVLNDSLHFLAVSSPNLTTMPALPASLDTLGLGGNSMLTSLPELPASLRVLNLLYSYNINCLPRLPLSLQNLYVPYFDHIKCLPNSVSGLQVYNDNSGITIDLPLCNAVTNVDQCIFFPTIKGHFFYDNNSNGIKDGGENFRSNVGVSVSSGGSSFSDNDGYFEISADTGNITLAVDQPLYYSAVPAIINYHFITNDTITDNLIALQPNAIADSVTISIVPVNTPRPGNSFFYNINYDNIGTTTTPATIVMNYDNAALTFVSGSNPMIVNNGSSLSLSQAAMVPGENGSFTAQFLVAAGAPMGSVIHAYVTATANGIVSNDSTSSVVVNSLDPNDKYATPKLTTQQVSEGKYIEYVIRFQNIGTANAINIVITDTLSSFLNENSLEIINASHLCKVTRDGKNISFEFLNIQLPGMNVNEPASHGFVKFRIQPVGGVPVSSVIPNIAAIYFDYNSPVITNIANTLIDISTVPLTLLSFKALIGANDNILLYWNTTSETNTSSFDIEQSSDGMIFNKIGNKIALGNGNNTYSFNTEFKGAINWYRLKMIDIDGRYTYSQVIIIKTNKTDQGIVLLGNPVKNTLSIIVNDPLLVNTPAHIINEQGQLVQQFNLIEGSQQKDISNLAAGIYYLKTNSTTQRITVVR